MERKKKKKGNIEPDSGNGLWHRHSDTRAHVKWCACPCPVKKRKNYVESFCGMSLIQKFQDLVYLLCQLENLFPKVLLYLKNKK